jgi:hypothetical protein
MTRLNSGYFPDFKGGPTVLLWGEKAGVGQLVELLRMRQSAALAPFVDAVDGKAISVLLDATSHGMHRGATGFDWSLSSETMLLFADLLAPLVAPSRPGHQYLRCGKEGIEVMVSVGEYPPDLRP